EDRSPHGPELSRKAELAEKPVLAELRLDGAPSRRPADLARGDEDADRDREIEPAAVLLAAGGSEVDEDASARAAKARIDDRGRDALAALSSRTPRKADDLEGVLLRVGDHVDLDVDRMSVESVRVPASKRDERGAGG